MINLFLRRKSFNLYCVEVFNDEDVFIYIYYRYIIFNLFILINLFFWKVYFIIIGGFFLLF